MNAEEIRKLPTPETDTVAHFCIVKSRSIERRLAAAVMALESIAEYWNGSANERAMTDACDHNRDLAEETLAAIKEAK